MIAPLLTIVAAIAVVALPWGLPAGGRLVLPLVPFLVIHAWTIRAPGRVPDWGVFAAGLLVDVLTDGPLGYWAAVYLVGYAASVATRRLAGRGLVRAALHAATILAVMALVETTLAAVYFGGAADGTATLSAVVAAALVYPVVALPVRLASRPAGSEACEDILLRGGPR